jgi:hypothetical protein
MTGTYFILLMFMSGSLSEYTVRDSLSECLKAKRTIERQTGRSYSVTWSCRKLKVKINEQKNIVEFLEGNPKI